ncbi:ATP-binding protein [Formosimonas limnophila]|uniref:ATP-binding protein n=1 Tax=Formosimonas limnophila TaxID=1384487 RepID=UPI003570D4B7
MLHEALWIQADSKLIQRAVINLITNAIRYSPDDTQIRVTVSASTGYVALA